MTPGKIDFSGVASGVYTLFVQIQGKGFATVPNSTITVQFVDFSIAPVQSSFAGGKVLTIVGKLFEPSSSYVEVCGFNCKVDTTAST